MVVTETPSKNAFYFTWKALSFLRSLNFCPVFFSNVDKRLYKKPKVNFKIEIYMFIDISRNKSNQAIKFGKLTKRFVNTKNTKTSGPSLPGSYFWMIFREEYFSTCILLTNQISVPDSLYFLRYCAIWVCFAFYEVTNFEIMLSFLTKPCYYITKKVRTKI